MTRPYQLKQNNQYLHGEELEEARATVRRLRDAGTHPVDLARGAGLSGSAVYAWYAGSQDPSRKSYDKLRAYLSRNQPKTP